MCLCSPLHWLPVGLHGEKMKLCVDKHVLIASVPHGKLKIHASRLHCSVTLEHGNIKRKPFHSCFHNNSVVVLVTFVTALSFASLTRTSVFFLCCQ